MISMRKYDDRIRTAAETPLGRVVGYGTIFLIIVGAAWFTAQSIGWLTVAVSYICFCLPLSVWSAWMVASLKRQDKEATEPAPPQS